MKFIRFWKFLTGLGSSLGLSGTGSYFLFFAPRPGTAPLDYVFSSRWVGAVMVLAWVFQIAGAWLKRFSLQKRFESIPLPAVKNVPPEDDDDREKSSGPSFHPAVSRAGMQITFYMIMHPVISGLLLSFGLHNLFPGLGTKALSWFNPFLAVLIVAGALASTLFTGLAFVPPGKPVSGSWRSSPEAGYCADLMLLFSLFVLLATIFGMPAMMQGIRPLQPSTLLGWAATILLFIPLLWIGLMFFYMPFRLLLSAEKIGTWGDRLSSLIAMAPIIVKYIIG